VDWAEISLGTVQRGAWAVIAVGGELDVYNAARLKQFLIELLDRGQLRLLADLNGLTFIDSTGLSALVSAMRRTKEREGLFGVVCGDGTARRVIEVSGVDKILPVFASEEEAVSALE
jgi:anti-sigma B factor antagonist